MGFIESRCVPFVVEGLELWGYSDRGTADLRLSRQSDTGCEAVNPFQQGLECRPAPILMAETVNRARVL